jgi:hypothetical protein
MKPLLELAKDIEQDKITPYRATRQQLWNEAVDRAQEQWDQVKADQERQWNQPLVVVHRVSKVR